MWIKRVHLRIQETRSHSAVQDAKTGRIAGWPHPHNHSGQNADVAGHRLLICANVLVARSLDTTNPLPQVVGPP
jgi:hypothetical protein